MKGYDSNGNKMGKGKGKTYGNEQSDRIKNRRSKIAEAKGDPFDWRTVNPEKLLHLVAIVAACGGAVRIGATRDGGAMAVGYYLEGDSWTEYVRPAEDIEAYFDGAIQDWLGECESRGVDIS